MNNGWPAPAKLNLFLHITGRREDGYHLLQTVFQFLDYGDRLYFTLRDDVLIQRLDDLPGVAHDDDLIIRAARMLHQQGHNLPGVDIKIEKRLPMGGGLGGGSSDAATTLVALNRLWKLGLSPDELGEMGLSLGADVPIFVHGEAAWAEGVGEQISTICLPEPWFVVVIPPVSVPTAEIFQSAELTRDCRAIKIRDFLEGAGQNVCEPVVRKRYPEVARAMDWLDQFSQAKLTGTGACIFAIFEEKARADEVIAQLPGDLQGFVARGKNRSPLLERLEQEF